MRRRHVERRVHFRRRLADAQAADRVAGEIHRHELLGRFGPQLGIEAALHDGEQRLVGARRRCAAALGPADAAPHRVGDHLARRSAARRRGRTPSRRRCRVVPEWRSDRSGVSSTRRRRCASGTSTPCSSIVVAVGEAEDLEAAAVGEDRAVPAHERVQPAERRDRFLARPQRQVVRVGQDHLRAGLAQAAGVDALDGALRADRHEGRHFDRAMRRGEACSAAQRAGVVVQKLEAEWRWHVHESEHPVNDRRLPRSSPLDASHVSRRGA